MKSLRPLAGALLATLVFLTAVSAAEVDIITPGGGDKSLTPPPQEPPREEPPREAGSSLPVDSKPSEPKPRESEHSDSSERTYEPPLQTRHFGAMVELTCSVGDGRDTLVVVNHSEEPLPPGTRIKWQLKADGVQGFFRLLGTLDAGETLVADNVLQQRVDNGGSCVARVI